MTVFQLTVSQYECVYGLIHMYRTETQVPNGHSAFPQHLTLTCLPLSYNFTPINLTHLITVPAPRPQRSHILHTPLPPFWAQPQLWNPTTNNSLACSVTLDWLTVPPATNNGTSRNQTSNVFFFFWDTDRQTVAVFLLFMPTVLFLFCVFSYYTVCTISFSSM